MQANKFAFSEVSFYIWEMAVFGWHKQINSMTQ